MESAVASETFAAAQDLQRMSRASLQHQGIKEAPELSLVRFDHGIVPAWGPPGGNFAELDKRFVGSLKPLESTPNDKEAKTLRLNLAQEAQGFALM